MSLLQKNSYPAPTGVHPVRLDPLFCQNRFLFGKTAGLCAYLRTVINNI